MRSSKTLARIRGGETVRLCTLGNYIPSFIRHAAHVGYDCIWLDLEHRNITGRDVLAMLTLTRLYDIDCMIRPTTREKAKLYRYLEDGASGLMIPHVSTADEARQLVQSVKFPPLGDRGIDGSGLENDFLGAGPEFAEESNRETFLALLIETPTGVANVDEIAAVPGVDALFVGPGDLGLRLRLSPELGTIEEAITRTAQAAAKHGKAWGCPVGSPEEIQKRRTQGGKLLARGGDFVAILESLERWSGEFDQ